jgi:uncharacterized protein YsxB (DUF464 family)
VLQVTFYRDGRDRVARISARGHAGFADYGNDVVCAAVSAILQAARLGIEAYLGSEVEAGQRSGRLELAWPEPARANESVRAIVTTAELAIEEIARQYPNHVRLRRHGIARRMKRRSPGRVTTLADRRRRYDV